MTFLIMSSPRKRRFPKALKASRHLSSVDKRLSRVIQGIGSVKIDLEPDESIFESLAISIIYQQLHGKAAAAIATRLKSHFSKEDSFPSPEQLQSATLPELRSVGLSESKARALQDLAQKTKSNSIPDRATAEAMSDKALIEAFTTVKGIGPWTAQMLLIFTLGRTDVLPIADYGVRKGFALLYGKKKLPTPKELEKFGELWKPYRSAASWYLWRVTELPQYKGIKF